MSEAGDVGPALAWIVGLLERHVIPYQVVGGLAARAYGATRPVNDVDLYVPFDLAGFAIEEIQSSIVWGPQRHVDDHWDLTFLKANFGEQRVEIGDSSSIPRFFDAGEGRWVSQRIDYYASVRVELFGVRVAVMPKKELVRYKLALGREVDLVDVGQISSRWGTA